MGEHFNSHMVENGWAIDKVVEYLDLTIIGSEEESKKDKMLVCAESDLYLLGYALLISPPPPPPLLANPIITRFFLYAEF